MTDMLFSVAQDWSPLDFGSLRALHIQHPWSIQYCQCPSWWSRERSAPEGFGIPNCGFDSGKSVERSKLSDMGFADFFLDSLLGILSVKFLVMFFSLVCVLQYISRLPSSSGGAFQQLAPERTAMVGLWPSEYCLVSLNRRFSRPLCKFKLPTPLRRQQN